MLCPTRLLPLGLLMLLSVGCAPPGASDATRLASTNAVVAADDVKARRQLVEHLKAQGIRDPKVLEALRQVPRHRFVPAPYTEFAYDDRPLPIGQGQTISQPFVVAFMTEAADVDPGDRVLEIGTGSGYQAAVLAHLAKAVYSVEILPDLAERARRTLADLGYRNVYVKTGNGYAGWPEHAPFDAIVVTAAPETIPPALLEQLAVNGKLVIPVGTLFQEIVVVTKTPAGLVEKRTLPVRFVPMTGRPSSESAPTQGR